MTRADLDKQPADVASMFDRVAKRYDLLNDVLPLGLTRAWRKQVSAAINPKPGERILDLAAGTGSSSRPLADAGAEVIAGDISEGMLAEGRRRQPDIDFRFADALELPFADDEFDVVTISFGLRNVQNVNRALREMRRVTRPGGRLVVAEFSTPGWAWFDKMYREYLVRALPPVARTISSNPDAYIYLAESIMEWPDQLELAQMLVEADWASVSYRNLSGGIVALHRAVNTPGERA